MAEKLSWSILNIFISPLSPCIKPLPPPRVKYITRIYIQGVVNPENTLGYTHTRLSFSYSLVDGDYPEEEKHDFEKEEKTGVAVLISEAVYESSENILDFTTLALSLFFNSFLLEYVFKKLLLCAPIYQLFSYSSYIYLATPTSPPPHREKFSAYI